MVAVLTVIMAGGFFLKKRKYPHICAGILVGDGGFGPPKSATTDLQSAPFGHSGTPPYEIGAGGRTRTPDLLITNQLLYQLSYTSIFIERELIRNNRYSIRKKTNCQQES